MAGAFTGIRRNGLLGLQWDDFDDYKATISINRGLVAVPYGLHETRGKTRSSRRCIDLDRRTVEHLRRWLREDATALNADAYLSATPI